MKKISNIEEFKTVSSEYIVDIVGSCIELNKHGANFKGCCPFHGEKTPSLSVSESRNMWKCFGCGDGGDSIGFIMKHNKLGYIDAIEKIAMLINFSLKYEEEDTYKKGIDLVGLEEKKAVICLNKKCVLTQAKGGETPYTIYHPPKLNKLSLFHIKKIKRLDCVVEIDARSYDNYDQFKNVMMSLISSDIETTVDGVDGVEYCLGNFVFGRDFLHPVLRDGYSSVEW